MMDKWVRSSALVILLVALGLLAFAQWLPALLFLPVGAGMLMWDGRTFSTPYSTNPNQQRQTGSQPHG